MRVALFPSAYAPQVGGVEELTRRLALRLRAAGDVVEVWTIRHPASLPEEEVVGGVRVRRFELPLPALRLSALGFPLAGGRALRRLERAARDFRPDVVHVQCFSANGVYAAALGGRLGVPLVVSLQGETAMDDSDVYVRSLAMRLGLRLGLRRAAAVTACSEFALDDARRFGLREGIVIPNGVETGGDASPAPLELPFDRFVLGLGRLVPKKGFDLLLEAFAHIAPRRPGLGLVIGGDGSARPGLEARAHVLGLADRVRLPGSLGRPEVTWAMANADVFVLPSRVEPFGIVVLEALRARRPVVVSSRGGAGEVVRDGREGLVVDPLDRRALAAAIERLLDEGELRERLAAAGHARAGEFDWAGIAARYRGLYGSLV
jgi:glycogen(starch) synthase